MKLKIIMILLCLAGFSCQNSDTEKPIAFDRDKWRTQLGPDYPYRDLMLEDLIKTDTLKRLNKVEILDLLGSPDKIDNNHLFYLVEQEHAGFFTLHTKTMVIKLLDDETVDWIKVHE